MPSASAIVRARLAELVGHTATARPNSSTASARCLPARGCWQEAPALLYGIWCAVPTGPLQGGLGIPQSIFGLHYGPAACREALGRGLPSLRRSIGPHLRLEMHIDHSNPTAPERARQSQMGRALPHNSQGDGRRRARVPWQKVAQAAQEHAPGVGGRCRAPTNHKSRCDGQCAQ